MGPKQYGLFFELKTLHRVWQRKLCQDQFASVADRQAVCVNEVRLVFRTLFLVQDNTGLVDTMYVIESALFWILIRR